MSEVYDGFLGIVEPMPSSIPEIKGAKTDISKQENNVVSHPNHYQSRLGIECKDVLAAATEDLSGYEAGWTWNAIKYLWRWKKKNGDEDLKKAIQCIEFILDEHAKEKSNEVR